MDHPVRSDDSRSETEARSRASAPREVGRWPTSMLGEPQLDHAARRASDGVSEPRRCCAGATTFGLNTGTAPYRALDHPARSDDSPERDRGSITSFSTEGGG